MKINKAGRAEYERVENSGANLPFVNALKEYRKTFPKGNCWIFAIRPPFLLLSYTCHICVDVSTTCSDKHLSKYRVSERADDNNRPKTNSGLRAKPSSIERTKYLSCERDKREIGIDGETVGQTCNPIVLWYSNVIIIGPWTRFREWSWQTSGGKVGVVTTSPWAVRTWFV